MLTDTHLSCWIIADTKITLGQSEWKRDMRFGTWKVTSLCRLGSLTTVARELARCKLDLVGLQVVRWDKGGTVRARYYNFFFCGKKK